MTKNVKLEVKYGYQTRSRGSNSAEYDIYVGCVTGTGQRIKTYEEWIRS